jgi:2Fe-2S ferredoxin
MPKIVFKKNRLLKEDHTVEVKDGTTILEAANSKGLPMGSNCGGVCGCSTCHVYVVEGLDSLEEPSDKELDRLDLGFDVKMNSRLGCQAEVNGEDLVVDVTEESLKAFLDENPDIRKHLQETGQLLFKPHVH